MLTVPSGRFLTIFLYIQPESSVGAFLVEHTVDEESMLENVDMDEVNSFALFSSALTLCTFLFIP